jgi:phage terminase large subunit-like protein
MMSEDQDFELGRIAAEIEQAAADARRYRAIDFWSAYPKQQEFFATGKQFRERALFAGSQLGKTEAASYETACHLTGLYPKDWPGKRFNRAIKAWCVSENLKMSRDILQKKLCGEAGNIESFGSGMIPKGLFVGTPTLARGEGDAIDTIQCRHKSGGISTLRFRTYQAGRTALQGETLDFIWLDEEPDTLDVYAECLARITATNGQLIITFTPLKGMTGVSLRYREEHSPDRTFVQFGIDDIPANGHIPPALRATIIAGFPEHEREARSRGEPMLGSGRVYTEPEQNIIEHSKPEYFPTHWRWGWGLDVGISHPTAFVLACHDVDTDTVHLVAEICVSGQTPVDHVQLMRGVERRVFNKEMDLPVAWPADADQRDKGTGVAVRQVYKQLGLRMMPEPASIRGVKGSGAYSVEAGVQLIAERERNGRLKIAQDMSGYLQERRLYHRKDGQILKLKDDILAAARYGILMVRYFKPLSECGLTPRFYPGLQRQDGRFAKGSVSHPDGHFDLFNV